MAEKTSENLRTGFENDGDEEFINEDEQVKVIEELEDPEEIEAAMEIIEEELDKVGGPGEDTLPAKTEEPGDADHLKSEKDTSKDKGETDDKTKGITGDEAVETVEAEAQRLAEEEARKKELADKFILSDEEIQKQPEDVRLILDKYKGKNRAELAKAAANAIAQKNPHLKDNEKAIDAVAEKIETGTNEQVLNSLIESQKAIGVTEPIPKPEEKEEFEKIPEELPPLPEDNEEINNAISLQLIKQLKAKYPDMPEDIESPEFKEWRRDLNDENPDNNFKEDYRDSTDGIRNNFQRAIYLKENYRAINNNLLVKEVELIKKELKKYQIDDPKDIGMDLSLVKDERGSLFNKTLNDLMIDGNYLDPAVVESIGDNINLLKAGKLAKKFIYENNPQILTHIANQNNNSKAKEVEKLKDKNLNTLGQKASSGHNLQTISIEEIQKSGNNEDELARQMAEIENSLDGSWSTP